MTDSVGPDSDYDVPVEVHIQELFLRSIIVFLVGIGVGLLILPISEDIIRFLWESHIPRAQDNQPVAYKPTSTLITRLQVVTLFALIASFPVMIYETHRFVSPGLYDNEETYFRVSAILSLLFSIVGLLLAHFAIIPLALSYLTGYSESAATVAYGLQETIGLMIIIGMYTIIVFHIPILILLAVIIGVVSVEWIRSRRFLFWFSFIGISFLFSPDVTGIIPAILSAVMIILFEITLITLPYIIKGNS